MTLPEGPVLLDASFVLALLDGEPRAQPYADVLPNSLITSVNLGEVLYCLAQSAGIDSLAATAEIEAMGVAVVPLEIEHAQRFAELKRIDAGIRRTRERRLGKLSLGDLCCLAFAWEEGVPVLTGDRHWTTVAGAGMPVEVIDFRLTG
ncbi:PIN domain-containing protein [Allokutzneria sp. NRRL B-24872]|uniref:PIN domain-containing protein n=1 Tax=Allokutzneria sp. NRRL B-24872 TaxID=1137961 RepID=UPI000A3D4005|nr:PIN domain-containing protein [Allokutzneria sp. NRRL B-24872]